METVYALCVKTVIVVVIAIAIIEVLRSTINHFKKRIDKERKHLDG